MQQETTFLNLKQASALLGVSERTFHQLRAKGLVSAPIEFGPRCLKWPRDELIEAVKNLAPRQTAKAEPEHLAKARAARKAIA